jgi:hypothetical protein
LLALLDAKPPSSAMVRFSLAAAREASAALSAVSALVGSIVASTCPALTCWPTLTFTAVRVPLTGKSTMSLAVELMLPVAVSTSSTLPSCTVTVRPGEVEAELVVKIDVAPSPTTTPSTATRLA